MSSVRNPVYDVDHMVILSYNTGHNARVNNTCLESKVMTQPQLVIATNNPGKVTEFRDLLSDCGWEVIAPSDIGISVEVDETGTTYAENARLKAQAFCEASGLPAIADDSGLEVDALGRDPGVLHHLNGWDGNNNDERMQILLDAMKDVPHGKRAGQFYSVIVVVMPDGREIAEQGVIEGTITLAPAGSYGWGYDPLFLLPERGVTLAQLSDAEKNRISHRAVAFDKVRRRLKELAAG
jgi:XTP/dITP diphosphohydrolase